MVIYAQGRLTQDLSAIQISPSVFSLIQIHASGSSQWLCCLSQTNPGQNFVQNEGLTFGCYHIALFFLHLLKGAAAHF